MQTVHAILKEKKLKITPQRLAIYHHLYNTNSHPTAENIYKSIVVQHPSMSLATVYKTIDSLKKAGLVQEINVGEDSFRYDANCQDHTHFICEQCNQVFDIPMLESIPTITEELCEKTNFTIHRHQLYFYGTCEDCHDAS